MREHLMLHHVDNFHISGITYSSAVKQMFTEFVTRKLTSSITRKFQKQTKNFMCLKITEVQTIIYVCYEAADWTKQNWFHGKITAHF